MAGTRGTLVNILLTAMAGKSRLAIATVKKTVYIDSFGTMGEKKTKTKLSEERKKKFCIGININYND